MNLKENKKGCWRALREEREGGSGIIILKFQK